MLYALLCYNNEAAVCGLSKEDDEAMMSRVRAAEEKIVARSKFGPRLRLMPTTAATFVKAGQDPLVIDGPFAETKEQLLGFWIVDCASLEDAIEVNNRSQYGLSTSIFTQDVNRAFTAMRDIVSGLVYINHGTTGAEIQFPFGGVRGTGNGHREAGQAALEVFTEWKSIYVDYSGKLQRAQIDNREELE